jgi:hypothetical protein
MSSVSKLPATLPAPRSAPATSSRAPTAPEFHELAQVPPAAEWYANIDNPNTRRAYRNDLKNDRRKNRPQDSPTFKVSYQPPTVAPS